MGDYAWKTQVINLLTQILTKQEKTLSGLTDLQAATQALTAEVTQVLADIQTALANDDPDAAVEAASAIVNSAVTNLQAGDPLNSAPSGTTAPGANPPASGINPVPVTTTDPTTGATTDPVTGVVTPPTT